MRGEVGVFEDLQTLLVIVVGIAILLTSTLYNWSAFGSAEQDQEMYDEVEHLIEQVEAWDQLRAVNAYGSSYPEFHLRQSGLNGMSNKAFQDHIKSDLNYNMYFDDIVISDGNHDPEIGNYSYYKFGKTVPEDTETVVAEVQYTLIFESGIGTDKGEVRDRNACILTVVVWH